MRRGWQWLTLLLVSLAFAFSPVVVHVHAQGRIDCNAMQSRILAQPVRYCVMLPADYDAAAAARPPRLYPVLYFLHGLGDNEQTLFKGGGWDVAQDLRREGQITDFLIVAPEGKTSFYINSADGHSRYSDFFIHEFIPYIESHYSIRKERSSRAISGVSMGGYGALRFAFAHPELFSSVSAQSAALFAVAPQRNGSGASDADGGMGQKMLRVVFGDPIDIAHWNANSPFVLAKQNRIRIRATGLSIYFNCGRDDEFGFEKGAADLDQQLTKENIPHQFHLYPGNHSAEYFLAHLRETLKFHSQKFASKK
jgi:S-formylglutathione hydrolase FrmB